jgi:Na+/phosphate symporter
MFSELNEKNLASVYKNVSTYASSPVCSETGDVQPEEDIKEAQELEQLVLENDAINLTAIQESNNHIYSFVVNLERSVSEVLSNVKDYIENSNEKLALIKKQYSDDVDAYKTKVSKYMS